MCTNNKNAMKIQLISFAYKTTEYLKMLVKGKGPDPKLSLFLQGTLSLVGSPPVIISIRVGNFCFLGPNFSAW